MTKDNERSLLVNNSSEQTKADQQLYEAKYEHQVKINENYPADTMMELYRFVNEAKIKWGNPVKVIFPSGKEYYWGKYGTWLGKQLIGGVITEQEFVDMLEKHNEKTLNIAKQEVENISDLIQTWYKELRQLSQQQVEAANSIDNLVNMYIESKENYHELLKKEKEATCQAKA